MSQSMMMTTTKTAVDLTTTTKTAVDLTTPPVELAMCCC
jgi:hypothetical protein